MSAILQTLDAAYKVVVIGSAGITAVVFIWKRRSVVTKVRKFFNDIEFIVSELKPNHGSSLKDRVTKLEGESAAQLRILDTQNDTIDHLIVHLARNDLHAANLHKEAEARLRAKGQLNT